MSILMTFRIALKALNRNKMRTVLTMLGMIIGVGAVITMVALGRGAQATIEEQVKSAGTNTININAGNFTPGRRASGPGHVELADGRGRDGAATGAGHSIRQRRRQLARPGHRRQPELVDADPGHRRRLPADSQLADEVRRILHAAGCQQRRQGRGAGHGRRRHALRSRRRSDRRDHPRSATSRSRSSAS